MKALCFGSLNIDYTYQVDHFVTRGETLLSGGLQVFSGGKGLNQSVAMARAGAKVWHAGNVGQDEAGAVLEAKRKKGNLRGTKADRNRKVQVWEFSAPAASAVRNSLAVAYEFEVTGDDGKKLLLAVSKEALRFPAGDAKSRTGAVCRVDCSRIKAKHFTVSLRAVSCWGRRSAPLEAEI